MNATSCCPPHPRRNEERGRVTKATSLLVSSLTLLLMPKCPICLAAYVTFITGLSLPTTAARHLHTALIIVLVLVLAHLLHGLWRRRAGAKPLARGR